MNLAALRALAAAGDRLRFVFFWSHLPRREGALGAECFSQWYPAPFELDGIGYPSAEHYMMAEKARLFGDQDSCRRILDAASPGAAKAAGRSVRDFSQDVWDRECARIVVRGNLAKFTQHPALGTYLAGTRARILAEASPTDRIWGIGLESTDPRAEDPRAWQGLNLLGFALMQVRQQLASGGESS
jgi:hypothetical protein